MRARRCDRCELSHKCKGPVWGRGDPTSRLWFIGEAPGKDEDKTGVPFCGKAGESKEGRKKYARIWEPDYTTNVVKCRPPKNRDPKDYEILACRNHLLEELEQAPAGLVIGALGRFASRTFLDDVDMEAMHGIPFRVKDSPDWIVVPMYHPAAGLHDGRFLTHIINDFEALSATLDGVIAPEDFVDNIVPNYFPFKKPLPVGDIIGVDTESLDSQTPFSVQIATSPGFSTFIGRHSEGLAWAKEVIESGVLVVLHNAQHDLVVLEQLGIKPKRWFDTMLMANLLQDVPRALKRLAFRLANMRMRTYKDVVYAKNDEKILPYLEEVVSWTWGEPDPVMQVVDGAIKWKHPWPLERRVQRILDDVAKGKCSNPYERWLKQKDRDKAELTLGPYVEANLSDVPLAEVIAYGCADADAALRVFPKLWSRIKAMKLEGPLQRDQGVVPMLARMGTVGFEVDRPKLFGVGKEITDEQRELFYEIKDRIGHYVNPCSARQVAKVVKRLGIKVDRTPTGEPSITDDFLQVHLGKHPALPRIARYRELDKLRTYIERLDVESRGDGRIHDRISQTRTATGRLASPLLLTIPTRTEDGRKIRSALRAGEGRVLLAGDYSQIELRVMAHMSNDPLMLEMFNTGQDIHTRTAAELFGLPVDKIDKWEHRYPAKTVNFGIPYGMAFEGLYKEMGKRGWTPTMCIEFIDEWFKLYSGVREMMDGIHVDAKRKGYVRSLLGRMRLIPEVKSVHAYVRNKGLRNAGNMPIQAGAQEIMKEAMCKLLPHYLDWRTQFYIEVLLQMHDDLIWEVQEDMVSFVAPRIKQVMEHAVKLKVPTPVDQEVGKYWGELKPLEVQRE